MQLASWCSPPCPPTIVWASSSRRIDRATRWGVSSTRLRTRMNLTTSLNAASIPLSSFSASIICLVLEKNSSSASRSANSMYSASSPPGPHIGPPLRRLRDPIDTAFCRFSLAAAVSSPGAGPALEHSSARVSPRSDAPCQSDTARLDATTVPVSGHTWSFSCAVTIFRCVHSDPHTCRFPVAAHTQKSSSTSVSEGASLIACQQCGVIRHTWFGCRCSQLAGKHRWYIRICDPGPTASPMDRTHPTSGTALPIGMLRR